MASVTPEISATISSSGTWGIGFNYTVGLGSFKIDTLYGYRSNYLSGGDGTLTIAVYNSSGTLLNSQKDTITLWFTKGGYDSESTSYWKFNSTTKNCEHKAVSGITGSSIIVKLTVGSDAFNDNIKNKTWTYTISMPTATNTIAHWAGGFNNSEGNNSSKTKFNLTSTSFKAYPGNSITYNSSRATTIPNGFVLSSTIGSSSWNNGVWKTYTMPATFTQPASNTSMQYDYYPNSYSISYTMNGGTNSSSNPSSYNVLYGITFDEPSRTGYTFNNWTIDDVAVTGINPGENASFSSSSDLYNKLTSRTIGNKTVVANWTANTYTVNFDANGGLTPTASKTVTYDSTYETLPIPTREGYDFNGWYTEASGGSKITSNTIVSITDTQTLYAQWSAKTYTITYDANGGTGAPDAQTKTHGVDLVLSTIEPTRDNEKQDTFTVMFTDKDGYLNIPSRTCESYNKYTFIGWDEEKNVMTASYAPGSKYTANASATLYANWLAVLITETITLPTAEECQKEGYELLGFSTTSNGAVEYAPGEEYKPSENITLYAIWSGGQTSVKYKINGQWVNGELYVKYNGSWRPAKQIYIKQNGTWKQGKNS